MSAALKKVLFAREVPYLATLLLALVAWIVMHLAERVFQSPTLQYESFLRQELTPQERNDPRIFPPNSSDGASLAVQKDIFRVTNISHSARFGKITFYLTFASGSSAQEQMRFAWTNYHAPAYPRTKGVPEKKSVFAEVDEKGAWYPVQELHPGWSIDLICFHTGEATPGLGFNTDGDAAVRLVETNCLTLLVRNEPKVLSLLLIASVVITIGYLLFISLTTPPPEPPK